MFGINRHDICSKSFLYGFTKSYKEFLLFSCTSSSHTFIYLYIEGMTLDNQLRIIISMCNSVAITAMHVMLRTSLFLWMAAALTVEWFLRQLDLRSFRCYFCSLIGHLIFPNITLYVSFFLQQGLPRLFIQSDVQ